MKKNASNKEVRVRFAPSPTGELHIGGARTALFNFLFASHNNGKIILRIEDTDAKRAVPGAADRLIESLKWLGIEFNESVQKGGKFGPYIQSQRLGIYQEYAQHLVEDGAAYYCFCTEERLKKMRAGQMKENKPPMYDRTCINLTPDEIKANLDAKKQYVIRMKVPYSGITEFDDLIRGHVEIDNSTIDDQILMKSDGMPTYHLANVVDDHLMEISHVLRAEEWLPSTPKHLILYKAFGWTPPVYAHLSMVLAPDHSKLSKRYGAVSIEEFRHSGYLPEAIINYIALLGWNPKTEQELFSLKELIAEFDITNVNKAGAIFDIEKLNYFNGLYIRQMEDSKLAKMLNISEKIVHIIKERLTKLSDFEDLTQYFKKLPKYEANLLIFKKSTKSSTLKGLQLSVDSLQLLGQSKWEKSDVLNEILLKVVTDNKLSNGDVFWPVRVALSGLEKSPSPVELLWVLGRNESLKRINNAIKVLQ